MRCPFGQPPGRAFCGVLSWGCVWSGKPVKKVSLALQGGGAHGAFVWGVVDQLLEDGRIGVEAISATSAGAMNGVALTSGLATGGPEAARATLHDFWQQVSQMDASFDLFSPWNQWIQAM